MARVHAWDLTTAIGEAYVELRVWRKEGALYPRSKTSAARNAIESLELAIEAAERLLGIPLADDCAEPLTLVTDNGPAFKSTDFGQIVAALVG